VSTDADHTIVCVAHFETVGKKIKLSGAPGEMRLREAQLGALTALVAHSTVSNAPAQLILPTGVGKTAIATLAPYVLGVKRVLVVVPGKLIRSQIAASFIARVGARAAAGLPQGAALPKVAIAEHRASKKDWSRWRRSDVVIGTPSVLSPGHAGVGEMPRELFDLVIFDEAHHLPAKTWTDLLESTDARAVLLTATPFRNDGKRLPGDLVYTYPLARAIERKVFGEVTYVPVEDVPGEDLDLTIAKAAAQRLESPEHTAARSRLLVRTDSVEHAESLRTLYSEVGVPLGVIVHYTGWDDAQKMRAEVEEGTLMGFVCVGALTEGFDFPALKIGAYHVPHKTLGPTLQFLGRLSRVGEIGGELLASRAAVTGETAALYREDAAWQQLLPELLDSAIAEEREIRGFVDHATVAGPLDLSPMSLTPARSVHIYMTTSSPDLGTDINHLGGAKIVQRIVHQESSMIAFVTRRIQRPAFLRLDLLDVPIYELHIVTWVEETGVLFVSTTTDTARRDLLDGVAPGPRRPLSGVELRRLLDSAKLERFFSIGTRATQAQASRTSYQTRAGSKTEDDITPADARVWELGHGMGRSGEGTFGFSVAKSKVWEPGAANSLFAFRKWCEEQAHEIAHPPATRPVSKLDLLGISEPLGSFPPDPIVAIFPTEIFAQSLEILIDGELVLPELVELWPDDSSGNGEITLSVFTEGEARGVLHCQTDGSVEIQGAALLVRTPDGETSDAAEYLTADPVTIFFADGSRVTGDRVSEPPPTVNPLASEVRRPRSWTGTAIRVEFNDPPAGEISVGTATAKLLAAEMPIVIQDHLPGELADFIGIDASRLVHEVRFVHCKASGGEPGARLQDVQELAAQAIRSVQWLAPGADLWKELRRRLDHRPATKILQGDRASVIDILDSWSGKPPYISWSMWLVQPGISNSQLDAAHGVTTLLGAVHGWVSSQNVDVALLCSD
jgi:superfamily II DNA or RNA helicase